jgi:hypothetical protein
MVTVEFYVYTDDVSGLDELGNNIIDRFNQDYPDATSEVNYNEDEVLFSININVEGDDIKDIDTFLCEEICHEYECYVSITDKKSTMSYYFDEDDEWVLKNLR